MAKRQSKHWCFTAFAEDIPRLVEDLPQAVNEGLLSFVAYQHEISPTTGHQHLQGYIVFASNQQLHSKSMKRLLGKAHREPMKGTPTHCIDYCTKAETRDPQFPLPVQIGTPPAAFGRKQDRYDSALLAAKVGKLEDIDSGILIRNFQSICRIADKLAPVPAPLEHAVQHCWLWGRPLSYRDEYASKTWPEAFRFTGSWEFYGRHEYVIIPFYEDYHRQCNLKLWLQPQAFHVNVKFSARMIRPRQFIVLCENEPDKFFSGADLEYITSMFECTHFLTDDEERDLALADCPFF